MKVHSLLPLIVFATGVPLSAHENEEQKLVPSDGAAGDQFGFSVAVSGETIVIGAPFADVLGVDDAGAIYVFVHDGASFVEEAKLVASDLAFGDHFGWSVAISGETIIAGSPHANTIGSDAGAAYVFVHNGADWTEEAKLVGSSTATGFQFGRSVSIDDDIAVIGAPAIATGTAGKAYVFARSSGIWGQQALLAASDSIPGNSFGWSASVAGNRALVGAINANGQANNSGAAYAYVQSGTSWTQEAKIAPANGASGDLFGASVSLFSSVIGAIGASGEDDNGSSSGAAYVYRRSGSTWSQLRRHVGSGAGDVFGISVSYSYNTALAGARLDDEPAVDSGSGRFFISVGGKLGNEILVASDAMPGDQLGGAVALDGCELVAGAVGNDSLGENAGAAYVFGLTHPLVTLRNGSGVNPICLTTTVPPVLGETWEMQVDASGVPGAAFTEVICHRAALAVPMMIPAGELLVNRQSPLFFSSILAGSGVNTHEFLVPNDPFLAGLTVYVQGLIRNGSNAIIELCNAEDVRIGCHQE